MKTYDLSKHNAEPDYVFCPHCAEKNPKSAYVCLKCYKVIAPTTPLGWLKFRVPVSISITVIVGALLLAGIHLADRWLSTVEGNMTINVKTNEYNVSVKADKKRQDKIKGDVTLEKNPPEPKNSSQ